MCYFSPNARWRPARSISPTPTPHLHLPTPAVTTALAAPPRPALSPHSLKTSNQRPLFDNQNHGRSGDRAGVRSGVADWRGCCFGVGRLAGRTCDPLRRKHSQRSWPAITSSVGKGRSRPRVRTDPCCCCCCCPSSSPPQTDAWSIHKGSCGYGWLDRDVATGVCVWLAKHCCCTGVCSAAGTLAERLLCLPVCVPVCAGWDVTAIS